MCRTDDDCRARRNADGQTGILRGDAQPKADIETEASRPARLILQDAGAAVGRVEDAWRRMPPEAWARPAGARIGQRPAWKLVWTRRRETVIHHVDLDAGYTHAPLVINPRLQTAGFPGR